MPILKVANSDGQVTAVEFESGLTLMEVLTDEGYEQIQALCGGCCSCGTCHVHIDEQYRHRLEEMEEDEAIVLEYQENYSEKHSRLSCQIELSDLHDGLRVQIVDS